MHLCSLSSKASTQPDLPFLTLLDQTTPLPTLSHCTKYFIMTHPALTTEQLVSKLHEIDRKLDTLDKAVTPIVTHLPLLSTLSNRLEMIEHTIITSIPAQMASIASLQEASETRASDKALTTVHQEIAGIRKDLQAFTNEAAIVWATREELNALKDNAGSTPHKAREPKIAAPPVFTGKREDCKAFLSHCSLVFGSNPTMYPDDRTKIRYALSYLSDNPKKFFLDHIAQLDLPREERPTAIKTFKNFSTALTESFGIAQSDVWAETQLRTLRHTGFAVDYTAKFRTYAKMTSWNDAALCSQYTLGLKESIQDKLAEQERILDFEKLIAKVHQIDNMQRANVALKSQSARSITSPAPARHPSQGPRTFTSITAESNQTPTSGPSSADREPTPTSDPMDLSQATRLSPHERAHRKEANLCYYCGRAGHIMQHCLRAKKAKQGTLHNTEAEAPSQLEFELGKEEA